MTNRKQGHGMRCHKVGLCIRGHRGNPKVRASFIRFARWLRRRQSFPTLLPVYLVGGDQLRTIAGDKCTASFFGPHSRRNVPYIRIATGNFLSLEKESGRDGALAAFLTSLAHEIIHYQQWLRGMQLTEQGVVRKAAQIVRDYAETVDRP